MMQCDAPNSATDSQPLSPPTPAECTEQDHHSLMRPSGSCSSRDDSCLSESANVGAPSPWSPTGIWYRDILHFVGPGWFVSIAYVDPGNYQADIQAGALSRYSLLCVVWWTSILSIYVQVLCVRLGYRSGMTLAEAQARYAPSDAGRYVAWALAELSTVITDLPEVIGFGIACRIFFGWPYYVGVLLSLITTMLFLVTLNYSVRVLEGIVAAFVGIMGVALFVEMDFVGPDYGEFMEGWVGGFKDLRREDIFQITGVVGAVVMPHNLYLHTAACQSRKVERPHVDLAVRYSSIEAVPPIVLSFFVNAAVVAIAAETVYDGTDAVADVGLTDFCDHFRRLAAGCSLWAVALLAAGQSSAITTTYTGQYVMDGFLNINMPIRTRAIMTRLVAIAPCVVVAAAYPDNLNRMVNIVNSSLAFLLPFAFTPLVVFNCSEKVMGRGKSSTGVEKACLYLFAVAVYAVNALGLSMVGGGFFGDMRATTEHGLGRNAIIATEVIIQAFYAWWNWSCVWSGPGDIIAGEADSGAIGLTAVRDCEEVDSAEDPELREII
mmetsp:Transcript_20201/g.40236  ORF Transcript_20201/g.40236 Transcript_20201/m.40236 type:complete len:549 (-) Transcript_20201:28-1674(-)